MSSYKVAQIDEIDDIDYRQDTHMHPVRHHLGITAFGTNAYTAEKGDERVVEEHYERDGAEELYFVAGGRATFTLGDETIDAPAGTFIYAEPGTKRGAIASEPKTTIVAFGARPGVPHEISGWEEIFVAFGHLRNGDEEEGRKAMARAVAERPDAWQGQFNAACFESLTGNRDATFEHLRRAIELDPQAAEFAQKDSDFDWLRDDPEFPA